MKKIIPAFILALALCSCAVKTVSRTELFTPTTTTLINSKELTDMKYYGSDNEYDYFSRGFQRLRVARSESAIPSYARFDFNNWQNGKKYTECITTNGLDKLKALLSGDTSYTATQVPTTTTTTNTATQQQRVQALQTLLQSFSQQ